MQTSANSIYNHFPLHSLCILIFNVDIQRPEIIHGKRGYAPANNLLMSSLFRVFIRQIYSFDSAVTTLCLSIATERNHFKPRSENGVLTPFNLADIANIVSFVFS